MSVAILRCLPPTTLGDAAALDAARKLKRKLPSRIHIGFAEEERTDVGHKKRVEIEGTVYESMNEAARAYRVSPFAITKWLEKGKANLVLG